jgi:hypothetical protein
MRTFNRAGIACAALAKSRFGGQLPLRPQIVAPARRITKDIWRFSKPGFWWVPLHWAMQK